MVCMLRMLSHLTASVRAIRCQNRIQGATYRANRKSNLILDVNDFNNKQQQMVFDEMTLYLPTVSLQ